MDCKRTIQFILNKRELQRLATAGLFAVLVSSCGDKTSGSEIVSSMTPSTGTQPVGMGDVLWNSFRVTASSELPACNDLREGQLFYVSNDKQFRACTSQAWEVVSITGPQGSTGAQGAAGTSCSVTRVSGGANVACGVNAPVFVADGINGANGASGAQGIPGTSCTATRVSGGANIVCGTSAPVFVADGATGASGATGSTGASGATGSTGASGVDGRSVGVLI